MRPSRPTERSWFRRNQGQTTFSVSKTWPVPLFVRLFRFEAALDPVRGLDAVGRIDLLGRIALDVDDGELAALDLGLAVHGFHDRLVALADRHADCAARAFEGRALQRGRDLL